MVGSQAAERTAAADSMRIAPLAILGEENKSKVDGRTNDSDLDWHPSLTRGQKLFCSTWSCLAVGIAWQACRMFAVSSLIQFPLALAVAGCVYSLIRSHLLEAQYQGKQRMEVDLADRDSHFHHIANVRVHVKSTSSPHARALAHPAWSFHCYHGFGSNTYTWALVHPKLANAANALVTAHDMPGFGLTQRPHRLSEYCLAFNGRLGRLINDRELAALNEQEASSAQANNVNASPKEDPSTDPNRCLSGHAVSCWASSNPAPDAVPKRVLIGHSIGSVCAAMEAIAHVDGLRALVLVAPAIPAFPNPEHECVELLRLHCSRIPGSGAGGIADLPGCHVYEPAAKPTVEDNPKAVGASKVVHKGGVFAALMQVGVVCLLLWLVVLQPIMLMLVRSMVRTKAFWTHLLQAAHFDKATVTPRLVDAYRMPQLVRSFEVGVVKFLIALPNSLNMAPWSFVRGFLEGSWREKLVASRLSRQVARTGLPVLIIHGAHDKVIPLSNSMRLARSIPGCQLVVMQRCGHVPQEEHPDLFVQVLEAFLDGGHTPL